MAYREVSVFEIKEVLRLWLRGESYRGISRLSGVDRKTVHRYVQAAVEAGVVGDGGEAQLSDVVIGVVCERVRPARPAGHGAAWECLVAHEDEIKAWLGKDLKLVNAARTRLRIEGATTFLTPPLPARIIVGDRLSGTEVVPRSWQEGGPITLVNDIRSSLWRRISTSRGSTFELLRSGPGEHR